MVTKRAGEGRKKKGSVSFRRLKDVFFFSPGEAPGGGGQRLLRLVNWMDGKSRVNQSLPAASSRDGV